MSRCGCAGSTTFLLGSAANADAQNCEREHDTCASNRRTAQATKPVFYSHAVIVIPFRISGQAYLEARIFMKVAALRAMASDCGVEKHSNGSAERGELMSR